MNERIGREVTKRDTGLSILTQNQAAFLLKSIWKGAPDDEIIKAAMICQQYQLNPLMRQVYLIQFNKEWVTVLGIKATRQIAQKHHRYSYVDGPRIMSEEEQKKILGEVDTVNLWSLTIIKDKEGNIYPGYGNWPKGKMPYGSDKGNSPRNMAFIRSERNAIDKMAPGELPDLDVGSDAYEPISDVKVAVSEGQKEFLAQVEESKDLWEEKKPEPPPAVTKPTPERTSDTRGGIEVKGSTAIKEEVETLIETLGKELTEKVEAKASTATQRAKLFQKAKNMTYSEADLRNILERHYHKKNTIDLTSAEVEEFTGKVEAGATINAETGEWNQ